MTAQAGAELVADGLSFPTSLSFDDDGSPWVAEAGLPFGGAPPRGRVLRLAPDGERHLIVEGLPPPVNGLFHHRGVDRTTLSGLARHAPLLSDRHLVARSVGAQP